MNVLTPSERADRDCRLDCPPEKHGYDDGGAQRCPHGRWFVYTITNRSGTKGGPGDYSEAGKWRRANPTEKRRIRKAMKGTR